MQFYFVAIHLPLTELYKRFTRTVLGLAYFRALLRHPYVSHSPHILTDMHPNLLTDILCPYARRNKGSHTHRHTHRIYSPTPYIALYVRQHSYGQILTDTLNDTLTYKRTDRPTSLKLNTHHNI